MQAPKYFVFLDTYGIIAVFTYKSRYTSHKLHSQVKFVFYTHLYWNLSYHKNDQTYTYNLHSWMCNWRCSNYIILWGLEKNNEVGILKVLCEIIRMPPPDKLLKNEFHQWIVTINDKGLGLRFLFFLYSGMFPDWFFLLLLFLKSPNYLKNVQTVTVKKSGSTTM